MTPQPKFLFGCRVEIFYLFAVIIFSRFDQGLLTKHQRGEITSRVFKLK